MKVEPRTLKGFRDFLPKEARKRAYVLNILKKVFESYGFEPLETPVLEYEEILSGKYGDEGDKLMYKFTDNGGRCVAMRYDQTVPLARVVAQYQNDLPLPFKRYQIQNVYRAENTQRGRFREFLQVDVDTVGSPSPLADAEIVAIAYKSLESLGFKKFQIFINDRETLKIKSTSLGTSFDPNDPNDDPQKRTLDIFRALDKFKKIGEEGVIKEIMEKTGSTEEQAKKWILLLIKSRPSDFLGKIVENLKLMGVPEEIIDPDPTLSRGLDYYTGLIFEIEIDGYSVGSVAGGGRYDNLIGMFAGKDIPAVGFAFGFDRVIEAMDELDLFPANLGGTKVLITNTGRRSLEVAQTLREEGLNIELYSDEKDLDKQLKYADKKEIPYVIIVNEANLRLKNMVTGEQKETNLEDLPDAIR